MPALKSVDVIVKSKTQTITRASRVLVQKRTRLDIPAGSTADDVQAILDTKGITARITTWAQASEKVRTAAADAKAAAAAAKV